MKDCLREKVGLLRERLKISRHDKALYRELSDLLFQAGKISAAMNVLERSLFPETHGATPDRQDGSLPESRKYFDRGLEYADAYLYEDAVDCFLQALELGQDSFDTHYCLAGVYKSLELYPQAVKHCRRSVEINPRFAPGYILLGALLKKPGELGESVTACKKALLLDPDCLAAYYDLACYYSLMDKQDQAMATLEMALCKGFCDFEWLMRDPDLETVRRNPGFELLIRSYSQKSL